MRQDLSTGYEFLKQPSLSSLPGVKTLWNSAFIDACDSFEREEEPYG